MAMLMARSALSNLTTAHRKAPPHLYRHVLLRAPRIPNNTSSGSAPHVFSSSSSSGGGSPDPKPSRTFPWREMWWLGASILAPNASLALSAPTHLGLGTSPLAAAFLGAAAIRSPGVLHLFPNAIASIRNVRNWDWEGLTWRLLRWLGGLMVTHFGALVVVDPTVRGAMSTLLGMMSLLLMLKIHRSAPSKWKGVAHAPPVLLLVLAEFSMLSAVPGRGGRIFILPENL